MTRAVSGRPVRFFGLVMTGWVAARLAGFGAQPLDWAAEGGRREGVPPPTKMFHAALPTAPFPLERTSSDAFRVGLALPSARSVSVPTRLKDVAIVQAFSESETERPKPSGAVADQPPVLPLLTRSDRGCVKTR